MAEKQLDSAQVGRPLLAQFGARAASVVRGDARNDGRPRIPLEHLPDGFLTQPFACDVVGAVHRPKDKTIPDASPRRPCVDRHLHRGGIGTVGMRPCLPDRSTILHRPSSCRR